MASKTSTAPGTTAYTAGEPVGCWQGNPWRMRDVDLRVGLKVVNAASEGHEPWIVLKHRELLAQAAAKEGSSLMPPSDSGVPMEVGLSETRTIIADEMESDAEHGTCANANADHTSTASAAISVAVPPTVCLQIAQYANIETADSIRAYVEKFTPVSDVQLIKANKARGICESRLGEL